MLVYYIYTKIEHSNLNIVIFFNTIPILPFYGGTTQLVKDPNQARIFD